MHKTVFLNRRLVRLKAILRTIRFVILTVSLVPFLGPNRFLLATETLPFIVKDSRFRTNVGINNLDDKTADVAIALYDNNGTLLAQGSASVPALGFLNITNVVSYLFGYSYELPVEGFVRLESTANIAGFAAQILNETNDPGLVPSVRTGASHLLLPITTSIDPWRSAVSILNLGGQSTTVKISLRDLGGRLLASSERRLEPDQQWISQDIHLDLGIWGARGPVEVQSLEGVPLAVACRHSHIFSGQTVFQQPFDLQRSATRFFLTYSRAGGLHRNTLVLNNPNPVQASVLLRSYSSQGTLIAEIPTTVPGSGSLLLSERELFAEALEAASHGLIRGTSDLPLCGLLMAADLTTGDTVHSNVTVELSPEVLIPSVTQVPPFVSSLLLSNIGEKQSMIEIRARGSEGTLAVPPSRVPVPASGTVLLDNVLPALGSTAGYGPLQIRSLQGQPITASSQVIAPLTVARGSLNALDARPMAFKRRGQPLTLRWAYDPNEMPRILEYRIYRASPANRNFELMVTVPPARLHFSVSTLETGDFVFLVKAFDGRLESDPSNEVLLRVAP